MNVERSSAQLAQLAAQVKARERALSSAAQIERQRAEDGNAVAQDPVEVAVPALPPPPSPSLGGGQALNPAAAAFVPSFGRHVEAKEEANEEVQPNGEVNGANSDTESTEMPTVAPGAPHDDGVLSKSWAEVVQTGNGNAEEVERAQVRLVAHKGD